MGDSGSGDSSNADDTGSGDDSGVADCDEGVEAKVLRLRPGEYSFPTTVSLADACLAMYSTGEGEVVISAEAEERFFAVGSGGRLHLKARASPALTTASLFHELLPCLTLSPSALGCLSWLWRLPAPPAFPLSSISTSHSPVTAPPHCRGPNAARGPSDQRHHRRRRALAGTGRQRLARGRDPVRLLRDRGGWSHLRGWRDVAAAGRECIALLLVRLWRRNLFEELATRGAGQRGLRLQCARRRRHRRGGPGRGQPRRDPRAHRNHPVPRHRKRR